MNIVLTGFMGTGKSTVGRLLAHGLDFTFVDVDARIETEAGKSISRIFQSDGEEHFRKLEAKLAVELAAKDHQVIATGGGFVLNPHNITVFKPCGVIVTLTATPEVIYKRIKEERQRPLLAVADPLARISELLLERAPYYQNADLTVDTAGKNPVDLANEIGAELMRRGLIDGRSQIKFS
jgi:shikimate kinase